MAGLPDWLQVDTSQLPVMDPTKPPVQGSTNNSLVGGALMSGVRSAMGEGASALGMLGKAMGADTFAAKAADAAKEQQDAATRAGRPDLEGSIGDAWDQGIGHLGKYIAYQTLKGLPQMAAIGAAAPVAVEAAPEAALGMLGKTLVGGLGMGAAALPGAAGTIHEAIKERAAGEGREETQGEAATGLLGSPLLAAINTVVPGGIENIIAKGAEGDIARRVLTSGGMMAAYGAPQAALATAYTQQFGPPKSLADRSREIVDAALSGAVTGAVMGGVTGAVSPKKITEMPAADVGKDDLNQATQLLLPKPAEAGPANPPDVIHMGGEGQRALPGVEGPAGLLPPPLPEPVVPGSENPPIQMGNGLDRGTLLTDQHANDGQYLGESAPQGALPGQEPVAGAIGHTPAVPDENGQYSLPNLPEGAAHPDRPHAGLSDDAIYAELNALRDKHEAGGLTPAEQAHGEALFHEYETRQGEKNEPDVAEDHGPEFDATKDHQAALDRVIQTAQFSKETLGAIKGTDLQKSKIADALQGFGATDKLDLFNKVSDAVKAADGEKLTQPMRMLAEHLGIMDRGQTMRDLPAELAALDKQKSDVWDKAEDSATAKKQEAPIVEKMKKVQDLMDLKKQADMRRKEDAAKAEEKPDVSASQEPAPVQEGRDAAGPARQEPAPVKGQGKVAEDERFIVPSEDEQAPQGQGQGQDAVPAQEVAPPPPVDVPAVTAAETKRINDQVAAGSKRAAVAEMSNRHQEDQILNHPKVPADLKKELIAARDAGDNEKRGAIRKEAQNIITRSGTPLDTIVKGFMGSRSPDPATRSQQRDQTIKEIVRDGGHAGHVLDFIARTSDNPLTRNVANALRRVGVKSKIEIGAAPEGELGGVDPSRAHQYGELEASYEPSNDTIGLHTEGDFERKVLHEAVHAATHAAIDVGGASGKRIQQLYDAARKQLGYTGAYGLENVHEFVAEAFTRPKFRDLLSQLKGVEPKKTLWQSFKDAVFKMLGLGESNRTMLDDVMEAGHHLMADQAEGLGTSQFNSRLSDIMSGRDPSLPRSPVEADAHVGVFASMAKEAGDEYLETAKQYGWESLKNDAQRIMAGWATKSGITRAVAHLLKAAPRYSDLHELGNVVHQRLDHLHSLLTQPAEALKYSDRETYNKLNDAMADATQFRFDPRRMTDAAGRGRNVEQAWAAHDHLHDHPDVAQLRERFEKFYKSIQSLKQKGAYQHFENMRTLSDMDDLAKASVLAYKTLIGLDKNANVGPHPVDDFRTNDALHHDAGAARDYWQKTADRYGAYLKGQIDKIKGLSEPLRTKEPKGYDENRAQYEKRIEKYRKDPEVFKKMIADYEKFKQYKAYKDEMHPLTEIANELNGVRERVKESPNFHLGRDGEYMVSAHVKMVGDGDAARVAPGALDKLQGILDKKGFAGIRLQGDPSKSQIFMRVENFDQMRNLRDLLATEHTEAGVLDHAKDLSQGSLDKPNSLKGMLPDFLEKAFANTLSDDMWDHFSPDVKGQVGANLRAMLMDMYSQNSLTRMSQHRENIPGAQRDMVASAVRRGRTNTNAIAKLGYQSELTEAFASMRSDLEKLSRGDGTAKEVMTAHNALNELAKRMQARPWRVANSLTDAMRKWNHRYFISMSPAYVMEVLSQNGTLLLPELAKRHGFVKSAKTIAGVTSQAIKVMRAIASGPEASSGTINREVLMKAGIGRDLADFLVTLGNRGGLDMGSFTRDQTASPRGDLHGAAEKFFRFSTGVTVYMETFARVQAALAAKALHEADGRADKGKLEDYVDHVVNESQMRWNGDENPRMVGQQGLFGRMSPLMLSFTGYQTRLIEKLHQEATWALGKGMDKSLTPEAKAAKMSEARTFLAAHAAAVTIIGGTMGLPGAAMFAGLFTKGANFATGGNNYDIEASYRRWLTGVFGHEIGDVLAKGAPRALGVDTSHLGEQNLIPFTEFLTDRRKWEDAWPDWAKQMAGAPAGMVSGLIAGTRDISNGNYLQGAQKFLPTSLRNPYNAFRVSQFGYQNSQNVSLPIKADALDVLKQAVGLTPADKAAYDEKERTVQGDKEDRTFYANNIKKQLATAYERGDPQDISNMMTKAQEWDKGHLFNPILPSLSSILQKRRNETATAKALGTPLGVSIKNPAERGLVGW